MAIEASSIVLHGDLVLVATRTRPAPRTMPAGTATLPALQGMAQLFMTMEKETVHALECRDLHTGRVLWRRECGQGPAFSPHAPVWFDDYILVEFTYSSQEVHSGVRPRTPRPEGPQAGLVPPSRRTPTAQSSTAPTSQPDWPRLKTSMLLLDAHAGNVLREFGPRETKLPDPTRLGGRNRLQAAQQDLVREWLMKNDGLLVKTYLNKEGPTVPVPADIGQWSFADAELVKKALAQQAIPRRGAVSGLWWQLVSLDGDVFWNDGVRNMLCRTRLLSDGAAVWETPFFGPQLVGMVLRPPLLAALSGSNAIIAYDAQTGRPLWTYEWPDLQGLEDHYTRQIASLTDGILLLTDPQIPRPYTMRQFHGRYNSVDLNTRSCLTKLDPHGNRLFRQELPVLLNYGGMAVGHEAILVWNGMGGGTDRVGEGQVICLGRIDPARAKPARPRDEAARIRELIASYDAADVQGRLAICTDLARLGDTNVVDRVIRDLDAASQDLEARAQGSPILQAIRPQDRPQTLLYELKRLDHDRVYYVRALGICKDPRAIPKLLPLMNLEYLRQDVRTAILAITDGEPLKSEAYRIWREQGIAKLRGQFDQEQKYVTEKMKHAAQLRELQDPQLLNLLLEALKQAAPNERDDYVREIGMLRDKRAIPALLEMLVQVEPTRRYEVQSALNACTGVQFARPEVLRAWWQTHQHLYHKPASQPS